MIPRSGRLRDLQAQQVEVGRIRLGTSQQKTSRAGRAYNEPVKLEHFRLTSRSEQLIKEAALLYGGTPELWTPQSGGAAQWSLLTDTKSIPVIVPPNSLSQYYEQWTAGKCTRRCDGVRELLSEQPCPCGPDPLQKKQLGCKPTTRVSLMLADMNGIGVWRLETHGYNAASELPAVVDLLTATGGHVPARLEMEERSAQIPDPRDANKTVTSRFMVPVLHVGATPAAIVAIAGSARPAVGSGEQPALPGPEQRAALPAAPAVDEDTVKQQWVLYGQYEDRIAQGQTRDEMMALRGQFMADGTLTDEFKQNLLATWQDRAQRLAEGARSGRAMAPDAAPSPAPPPPAPTPDSPPAVSSPAGSGTPAAGGAGATPDRAAVWQQVMTYAGTRSWTLPQVKQRYKAMTGGGEISQANAGDLTRFKIWLEKQP